MNVTYISAFGENLAQCLLNELHKYHKFQHQLMKNQDPCILLSHFPNIKIFVLKTKCEILIWF